MAWRRLALRAACMIAALSTGATAGAADDAVENGEGGAERGRTGPASPWAQTRLFGDPRFRHAGTLTSIEVFDGGRKLLTAAQDGTARIWDAETGEELHRFHQTGDVDVWCARIMPDTEHVVTCGDDNAVTLWRIGQSEPVRRMEHGDTVFRLAVMPDGRHVVAVGRKSRVIQWDTQTGKEVRRFKGHKDDVYGVAASPDGRYVATAGEDESVRLFSVETGKLIVSHTDHGEDATTVAFHPDGDRYASVGGDKKVRLWRVDGGDLAWSRKLPETTRVIDFSPDGKWIAAVGTRQLRLIDTASAEDNRPMPVPALTTWPVACGPDGAVYCGAETVICRYDAKRRERTFPAADSTAWAFAESVEAVALGPDGKTAFSIHEEGPMFRWHPATGAPEQVWFSTERPQRLSISPDGRRLLATDSDGAANVHEVGAGPIGGRLTLDENGHDTQWAWADAGERIVGVSRKAVALFHAAESRAIERAPRGRAGEAKRIRWIASAPRRNLVAFGLEKGEVKFWQLDPLDRQGGISGLFANSDAGALTAPSTHLLVVDDKGRIHAFGAGRSPIRKPKGEAEIARLVEDLAADRYAVRERATRMLIAAGYDRCEAALAAVNASDPEVRLRVDRIRQGFDDSIVPDQRVGGPLKLGKDVNTIVAAPVGDRWAAVVGIDANASIAIGVVDEDGPRVTDTLACTHGAEALAFSADGRTLLVGNDNGTVSVYRMRNAD